MNIEVFPEKCSKNAFFTYFFRIKAQQCMLSTTSTYVVLGSHADIVGSKLLLFVFKLKTLDF